MVGRGLWFAAGAVAGVYGVVRARRVVEAFTVDGMRDRVGAVVLGARMFSEEVAQGAVEAETDLRERYEIAANGHRQVAAGRPERPSLVPSAGTPDDNRPNSQEDQT
jgi:hypothetical protein